MAINPWRPDRPELPRLALPLRIMDRCDRCGARAAVRATRYVAVLLFCSHHGIRNERALKDAGWQVERPPLAGQ